MSAKTSGPENDCRFGRRPRLVVGRDSARALLVRVDAGNGNENVIVALLLGEALRNQTVSPAIDRRVAVVTAIPQLNSVVEI